MSARAAEEGGVRPFDNERGRLVVDEPLDSEAERERGDATERRAAEEPESEVKGGVESEVDGRDEDDDNDDADGEFPQVETEVEDIPPTPAAEAETEIEEEKDGQDGSQSREPSQAQAAGAAAKEYFLASDTELESASDEDTMVTPALTGDAVLGLLTEGSVPKLEYGERAITVQAQIGLTHPEVGMLMNNCYMLDERIVKSVGEAGVEHATGNSEAESI